MMKTLHVILSCCMWPNGNIVVSVNPSSPPLPMATATTAPPSSLTATAFPIAPSPLHHHHRRRLLHLTSTSVVLPTKLITISSSRFTTISCKATEVSSSSSSKEAQPPPPPDVEENWIPVVPLAALPKGERRVIIQDGRAILLLWYKDDISAIENRSPAEGAYSEGLLNAKLTQDGCIVCPSTESTFDLQSGAVKEWFPNNAVLRFLTPPLRNLRVYPVKVESENIYIRIRGSTQSNASAEIVFSGKAQPGSTATDVNVDEVRMVIDEESGEFGFTGRNELINGKAAVIGFLLLLDFELLTGKGLLKGTGFLDFIYSVSKSFN